MKKMIKKYAVILALTVSAILFLPAKLFAQGAVIGYAWVRDNPTDEQLENLTHLIALEVYPNWDGSLTYSLPNWNPNQKNDDLESLVSRAHARGVKVSISVGGGGRSAYFASATNSTYRGDFVNNIANFVELYKLDGVDINWEYPSDTIQWNQCVKLFL